MQSLVHLSLFASIDTDHFCGNVVTPQMNRYCSGLSVLLCMGPLYLYGAHRCIHDSNEQVEEDEDDDEVVKTPEEEASVAAYPFRAANDSRVTRIKERPEEGLQC